jgi:sigma-B regulation protein RsbU (phosphoserine phosphatase)
VFPDWPYEDSLTELRAGDLLLLFTDGITEAMDLAGEEFGEERLIAAATNFRKRTAQQLQSRLLGDLRKFCNSRMNDDATLLIVVAGDELRPLRNYEQRIAYAGVQS